MLAHLDHLAQPVAVHAGLRIGVDGDRGVRAANGGRVRRESADTPRTGGDELLSLSELMVMEEWRKTGLSTQLHETLVDSRGDDVATLLVDVTHPKVQTLYESWGYETAGEQKPFDDSPVFAIMVKRLTVPA